MSKLGPYLLNADQLAAVYDTEKKRLILYARGDNPLDTSNVTFERDPHWVGGLKYSYQGYYPPYSKSGELLWAQGFDEDLTGEHFHPGVVSIVTKESGDKGIVVNILYLPLKGPVPPEKDE